MTVSNVVDRNDYSCDGTCSSFSYTFQIFQKTDLVVSVVDLNGITTELLLDSDYNVTDVGEYAGGTVVLSSPPANGWRIVIMREIKLTKGINESKSAKVNNDPAVGDMGHLATGLPESGYAVETPSNPVNPSYAELKINSLAGFDNIGSLFNIAELRGTIPSTVDMIVYVASSASVSHAEEHVGGGFFQSFDNSVNAVIDDGGIVIKPDSGSIWWRRINFSDYDMCFWGVKADGVTDNAAAITLATNYARANHIILNAPAGRINTSQMVPLYNNMGIRGHGKAESTVFYKTTNDIFEFKKNGVTQLSVDALVGFVPDQWDLADFSMESFAVHVTLIGCMFRRLGLNANNVGSISPAYGLFMGKVASAVIRQVSIEGGRTGIKAYNTFSGIMEMVSAVQYNGYGFIGIDISDYRNGIMYNSGTSMDMRIVQCRGYQFGFSIQRLQYSTMIDCTVEECGPMTGETISYAFDFTDPFCISMVNCATEFVKGGQIRVLGFNNPLLRPSLKVTGYLAIDQQNPVVPTPMFMVDNGGIAPMNIVFDACELSRDTTQHNLTAPGVSGVGAKVIVIGCAGEDFTAAGSGIFTRLA
ncbi:phage tail protein [Leclercia sp. M50]|uniref:phage tail protein n=1 Tax=Leclercia sp. M50 TaxID=3081258 RepID=UPI003015E95D